MPQRKEKEKIIMNVAITKAWADALLALPGSVPPLPCLPDVGGGHGLQGHPGSRSYHLHIGVVYQDEMTRQWAQHAVARAAAVAGKDHADCEWWDMHQLSNPAVGSAAFYGIELADIIIIAIRAADRLPVAFYAWVSSGLTHRSQRDGLLVALLAAPKGPCPALGALCCYLETAARTHHLDFLCSDQEPATPAQCVLDHPLGRASRVLEEA
jgi:hypothetical protein